MCSHTSRMQNIPSIKVKLFKYTVKAIKDMKKCFKENFYSAEDIFERYKLRAESMLDLQKGFRYAK